MPIPRENDASWEKKKKRKKEKKGYIETVDRLGSCCMYCTLWK